jgi:hypothetical protein
MTVVKREHKLARAETFLDVALREPGAVRTLDLLVRSLTSPVAVAVGHRAAQLRHGGTVVRLLIADTLARVEAGTEAARPWAIGGPCRHLADVRCHDAHEMLLLGARAVWVGDSLRRDPLASDSFELHATADPTAAALWARSFERLWAHAAPAVAAVETPRRMLARTFAALEQGVGIQVAGPRRH